MQSQHEIIKKRIKASFTKSAKRYDLHATFQRDIASRLFERIAPIISEEGMILRQAQDKLLRQAQDKLIALDLGCGTGFISLPLSNLGMKVFGIDFSSGMIEVAKRKTRKKELKYTTFFVADSEQLPFKEGAFSLVASNLMFQWLWDLKGGFSEVSRVLSPNGLFSFTILGKDSLKELCETYIIASERLGRNGLPPLIPFPEREKVKEAMKSAGFKDIEINTLSSGKPYLSLFQLLRFLKNIGAANPLGGKDKTLKKGTFLKVMEAIYRDRFSEGSGVKATYEVYFCSGRKG